MSKLPKRIFFDVNVAVRRGGGTEECRNGQKERRERDGKMKRRLMRRLTPRGTFSWLQTCTQVHTNIHAHTHTHLNTLVKHMVKAVNL